MLHFGFADAQRLQTYARGLALAFVGVGDIVAAALGWIGKPTHLGHNAFTQMHAVLKVADQVQLLTLPVVCTCVGWNACASIEKFNTVVGKATINTVRVAATLLGAGEIA